MCIPEKFSSKFEYLSNFYIDYNGASRYVGLFKTEFGGINFYFIDNEEYFGGPKPYGDWLYDIEKFIFFSYAALCALPALGFKPDLINCHDWQTGLVPVYLKERFAGSDFYRNIKSVMTIHNLKFQGTWDIETVKRFSGLSEYFFTSDKPAVSGRNPSLLNGKILNGQDLSGKLVQSVVV